MRKLCNQKNKKQICVPIIAQVHDQLQPNRQLPTQSVKENKGGREPTSLCRTRGID